MALPPINPIKTPTANLLQQQNLHLQAPLTREPLAHFPVTTSNVLKSLRHHADGDYQQYPFAVAFGGEYYCHCHTADPLHGFELGGRGTGQEV